MTIKTPEFQGTHLWDRLCWAKENLDGVQTVEITDAGKTQIPIGSLTVVAFGPCEEETLASLTGHLKLL